MTIFLVDEDAVWEFVSLEHLFLFYNESCFLFQKKKKPHYKLKVRSHLHIVGQLSKVGWKMVMCGDETWLKLFPGLFMRHDGVSSFFVSMVPESFDITCNAKEDVWCSAWTSYLY